VPNLWQVSPHLYKFRGPDFWPNFAMVLADSGRALVVDCGLFDTAMLDRALQQARARLGLKAIDAAVITHMHGDHFLEAPWLREKWGAAIWALDRMAPPCEQPERFDYAAQIPAYGKPFSSIRFDRLFKSGESFDWEGYRFTVDWMPGQTEFALCLHGVIDGQKVAFTGDNLFGDTADPAQTGHEALVARNSAILEEGYLYAAAYLKRLQPDLLIGGHSWVMPKPRQFIERYGAWAERMRRCFQGLSSESDYRYWFDPYWVRADPYRLRLKPGGEGEVRLFVRNFHAKPQRHRLACQAPAGVEAAPGVLTGEVAAASQTGFPVKVRAVATAQPGLRIVAVDVTLDERRYGQRFDFLVEVTAP
jgi:glyoxylase-like metal-dependent hydrolase (beta-lactamase superfamily II)